MNIAALLAPLASGLGTGAIGALPAGLGPKAPQLPKNAGFGDLVKFLGKAALHQNYLASTQQSLYGGALGVGNANGLQGYGYASQPAIAAPPEDLRNNSYVQMLYQNYLAQHYALMAAGNASSAASSTSASSASASVSSLGSHILDGDSYTI